MEAVAAQYRLSDQKEITPPDAVEDADDAIRWVRSHASELGVDPNRIAGYGWSAGAQHLLGFRNLRDPNRSSAFNKLWLIRIESEAISIVAIVKDASVLSL